MAFPDDDPESKFPPDDPNLLKNRSIPQRAIVISAGVIANIIFAYSLLFTQASPHTPILAGQVLLYVSGKFEHCPLLGCSPHLCHADNFSSVLPGRKRCRTP